MLLKRILLEKGKSHSFMTNQANGTGVTSKESTIFLTHHLCDQVLPRSIINQTSWKRLNSYRIVSLVLFIGMLRWWAALIMFNTNLTTNKISNTTFHLQPRKLQSNFSYLLQLIFQLRIWVSRSLSQKKNSNNLRE